MKATIFLQIVWVSVVQEEAMFHIIISIDRITHVPLWMAHGQEII